MGHDGEQEYGEINLFQTKLDIWFWSGSRISCAENKGNTLHFMEVKMFDARKWYELLANCYVRNTTWNKIECHRSPKYSTFDCTQNILSRKIECPISAIVASIILRKSVDASNLRLK